MSSKPADNDEPLDAVIVPGGGLDPRTAEPNPWVAARLDAALALSPRPRFFLVLSQGTPHRAPPRAASGHAVTESAASARYLMARGVAPARILLDEWSRDTIGNAFFARAMHADPLRLARVAVVTSRFHMPRARAVFDWVFALDARPGGAPVRYIPAPDRGLSPAQAQARAQKEARAVRALRDHTVPRCTSMQQLAQFVFTQHAAYAAEQMADFRVAAEPDDGTEKAGVEQAPQPKSSNLDDNTLSTY